MSITPFIGAGSLASAVNSNGPANRIQRAVDQLSSGNEANRAADNVADVSAATQLQTQVSELRTALTNTSQFSSLTQAADSGADQVEGLFGRLQELATQANSGALNDDNRSALDQEFRSVIAEINRITEETQFNGLPLLNGSVSGDNALDIDSAFGNSSTSEAALSIESLSASDLLDGNVSLATREAAEQAVGQIQQALNSVATTIAGIGAFSEQVDFASAVVETAISNQDAARANLADVDFAEVATELSSANLQQNIQIAVQAQSSRLPAGLLDLV